MGVLATLLRDVPRAAYPPDDYGPTSDFWYTNVTGGIPQSLGFNAFAFNDPQTAMHVSAFFNGIRILSETLAQPKLILYERFGDDRKERARHNRLYSVLHDQPNAFQTSYEFRVQAMQWLLLWGNFYAEIFGGGRGAVDALSPLAANHMSPVKLPNGRVGYTYREEDGTERRFTQDEIFHVRGFPLAMDGVRGLSALAFARQTTSMSLATQAYGVKLFENGAMHRVQITIPGPANKQTRDAIREEIQRVHAGAGGWHSSMILANGATSNTVSMNADDAQFLLTRKFEVVEVARWLNIAPHLLKDLERATFSNIEQQSLEFLQLTMLPWFINWEQAIYRDLIVQKNRFYAEFLVDSLVRADTATRNAAYATAVNGGWMTRNEVRTRENMNTASGLDKFLVDQNKAVIDGSGNVTPISQPAQPQLPAGGEESEESEEQPEQEEARRAIEHYRKLLAGNAAQLIRRESSAIKTALARCEGKPEKLVVWADKFYADQVRVTADLLKIEEDQAQEFVNRQKDRFLGSVKDSCIKGFVEEIDADNGSAAVNFVTGVKV